MEKCAAAAALILVYITPVVSLVGILLSIIMLKIFTSNDFKDISFKYIKYQTLFSLFNLIIKVSQPIYYCKLYKCDISHTEFVQYYYIGILTYVSSICEMVAQYCNIFSGLFCTIYVCEQMKIFKFLSFHKYTLIVIVLLSGILFSFQIFQKEIVNVNNSYVTQNRNETYLSYFEYTANIIRDGLSSLLLIIIDLLLLWKLRNIMKEKLRLLNLNLLNRVSIANELLPSSFRNNVDRINLKSKNQLKINRARRLQTITILSNCINSLISRLPILIYYIIKINQPKIDTDSILFASTALVIYVTNCVSFFIFYFSNERFKSNFYKVLSLIGTIFSRLHNGVIKCLRIE
jgi:hypothetical protein